MIAKRAATLLIPVLKPSKRLFSSTGINLYEYIAVTKPKTGVQVIQLNRPKALNALCTPLILELNQALEDIEKDDSIGAIVLTGSEKAFAAGADIKEMKDLNFSKAYKESFLQIWSRVTEIKKPIIGAVNGYALGGGCELAMMTDIIYAGENAVFGQPEVKLGTIPGGGGTQRLTRAIGKSRSMEIILTGKTFNAKEAYDWGLAARIFPKDKLVDEAIETASQIASFGQLAIRASKEAINQSENLSLDSGVKYERALFYGTFATKDQKEGMGAFAEKRNAKFTNE